MSTAAAGFAGFVNAEVSAAAGDGRPAWRLIQRFRDLDTLHAWRQSDIHNALMREADALVDSGGAAGVRAEERVQESAEGAVTEVFTTHVRPDKVGDYQEWAARIHQAEAQFSGYRGGYLQPPACASQPYWTTLVRFATPRDLDAWLNSSQRQELLREHEALVSSWQSHHLPAAFAGWFPADRETSATPPAWKQSMIVMLVLFPLVMLELRLLHPLLAALNPALSLFIEIAISIALTAWPLVPLAIRALRWWLLPAKNGAGWINPAGIALLIALYAAEIAALWHMLG